MLKLQALLDYDLVALLDVVNLRVKLVHLILSLVD